MPGLRWPLLAAFIVVPHGRSSVAWFSLVALLAIVVLSRVGHWYRDLRRLAQAKRRAAPGHPALSRSTIVFSLAILMLLIFSKYFYLASLNSYYTFYLIHKFHLSVQAAQLHLFVFFGRSRTWHHYRRTCGRPIWTQMRDLVLDPWCAPIHAHAAWRQSILDRGTFSVVIGLVLSSAFSAILVYAQELVPGKVGMIAGIFFGFAFGMGGLGAAVLGEVADLTSIDFVYRLCAFLPLLGIFTAFLPNLERRRRAA